MAAAPAGGQAQGGEPDVVTQLQEQVSHLSSLFYNYVGGLATPSPQGFPSLAEELKSERARAESWRVETLGRNLVQAQTQLEKLADALPSANAAEIEERIRALQAENAALEVQLKESLAVAESKIAELRAATAEVANVTLQEPQQQHGRIMA